MQKVKTFAMTVRLVRPKLSSPSVCLASDEGDDGDEGDEVFFDTMTLLCVYERESSS